MTYFPAIRLFAALLAAALWISTPVTIADAPPVASAPSKAAVGATIDKPMLWVIEGEKKPSYLFGTIHLPDERLTPLPEVVELALTTADAVRTEILMDTTTMMRVASAMQRTDGTSLKEVLPHELYARAARYLEKRGGDLAIVENFKTLPAAMNVALVEFMPQFARHQPLDVMIFQRAAQAGKDVGGLETAEFQIELFTGLAEAEQVHLFERMMETLEKAEKEGRSELGRMFEQYLAGDLGSIEKTMSEYLASPSRIERDFYKRLLNDRNVTMSQEILKQLKAKPERSYFFAVGAGHMPGEQGLLRLLGAAGYQVRRLTPSDASAMKKPQ